MTAQFAETGSVTLRWGRLAYRRTRGEGSPTVLLHPLALDSRMWELALGELGGGRDVIAIDLRGHGSSDWDGEPFTIADLASDVAGLLQSLSIDRCDLAGMSMGGCVAMTLAASQPGLVRNLALCDTTAWYGAEARVNWEERARAAEEKPRAELLPFQTKRWFSEAFRERSPEAVAHVVDIFVQTRGDVHAQACRALGAFDARPAIGKITSRTLALTGEEDYATPPAMGQALADAIPGAAFKQWPGVRHFSIVESAALRTYVAKHLSA